jgi:hypothetical protein
VHCGGVDSGAGESESTALAISRPGRLGLNPQISTILSGDYDSDSNIKFESPNLNLKVHVLHHDAEPSSWFCPSHGISLVVDLVLVESSSTLDLEYGGTGVPRPVRGAVRERLGVTDCHIAQIQLNCQCQSRSRCA